MDLVGCGTALVTPFRADGALDEPALRALVDWQIGPPRVSQTGDLSGPGERSEPSGPVERSELPGVDWLVACGTTGETPTLSHSEWAQVLRITAAQAGARVPVWAGCTSNSTREAVELAREAAAIPGITAILSASPPYNKPSQAGQFEHFAAVARAVAPMPLVLYNIPGRTGVNLEPATIARLAEAHPNIEAVKESSGNLAQIAELLTLVPRRFRVYSGDDAMALGVLGVGGAGLVSVASNAIPAPLASMVHAALANDWPRARALNHAWFPLILALFLEPNPGPVKALLAAMGRLHETYRLPMLPVAAATRERLLSLARERGLLDLS